MRKRRNSEEETSSEMDVDGEEKIEYNDEDDSDSAEEENDDDSDEEEEEEETENNQVAPGVQNPFLDSFYGLSSEDPRERVQAAQSILHCCLLGPNANSKDAAYAFRRLLNGLCSGRAAARQGNASALANFLKVAFHLKKMDEIREEGSDSVDPTVSMLEFVRGRLLSATDPSQTTGKKKGSEERDYQFGRLFGILGVVRSGVLVPTGNDEETFADCLSVASSFVSDIAELFWLKKWMREPSAHGITTLLKIFLDRKSEDSCQKIAVSLIKDIVVPQILVVSENGDEKPSGHKELFETFCAEQIGIASFIQSDAISHSEELPFPLDRPILTTETVAFLAPALGETSSVVHPRMHFVWDAVWCYLTETISNEKGPSRGKPSQRKLRSKSLLGDDSPHDIMDALLQKVVMQQLLRLGAEASGKATHERRSLAMCIVRNLSGALFNSSLTGPTQILLDEDSLENVLLTPPIIRSLFLEVICAGNQKSQSSHLLKPLSLNVLESLINTTIEDSNEDPSRRLALVRAFLKCEVRFDARTRTSTVASLLSYSGTVGEGTTKVWIQFWNDYRLWLESEFLESLTKCDEDNSSAHTTGFIELLYSHAKHILRVESESEDDRVILKKFKETTVGNVVGLFMSAAFFNCSSVEVQKKTPSKKKKGKKASQDVSRPVLEYGTKLKETLGDGGLVGRDIRSIISSRFFSLASDFVHMETHQPKGSPEAVTEKDARTLSILTDLCDDWKLLEKSGAVRFVGSSKDNNDDESDDEPVDPDKVVASLRSECDRLSKAADKESSLSASKIRCCRGITILAHTLYLHRLTSESAEDMADNDDPDIDEEDDEEEICNALEGLQSIMSDFLEDSNDANPLLGLAELCANTLSSPLGSGNIGRGASPKMVREAVKFAWLGGLRLSHELTSETRTLFDSDVVSTLLAAIGAESEGGEDAGESDDEGDADEGDSDDDDESDASSNENVFGQASDLLEEEEKMDVDAKEDESDVELDPSNLQSFLEEDSDASVNAEELEHHEGADAALAKLIALKQASRKAGQQAREKIEVSHQLRCTFLFEILFSRPESWSQLFQADVVLGMIVPLLKHRKKVEKSLEKMTDTASKSGVGDKRALLDRLSNLIRQKVGKIKLTAETKTVDMELHSQIVKSIMDEVKRAETKEQAACCSMSLVFALRSVKLVPDMVSSASVLGDAVHDWSTKRTTRLQASFFDDLIAHLPSLAQATLLSSLIVATQEARSSFSKGEAYRLIALLLSSKPNPEQSELDKRAMANIQEGGQPLLDALEKTLQDPEMRKAKRVRGVLKTLEKFLPYVAIAGSPELANGLGAVKKLIEDLGESESNAVKGACTKLLHEIDETVSSVQAAPAMETTPEKTQQTQNTESSSKKKKKKKKKKK